MGLIFDFFGPRFFPLHLILVFAFGSLWGSFFGLCIARIPAGLSVVSPGSYCFACGQAIRWNDNLPLLSYWLLRRRCRSCGTVFSSRHFWIELLSGLLFAWAFWARGYTPTILVSWIFTGFLLVGAFTDIDHWIIPDRVSLGGAAMGILLAAIPFPEAAREAVALGRDVFYSDNIIWEAGPFNPWGHAFWVGPANAAAGAAFGYGILWIIGKVGSLIFRKEAMGGGDIKLFAGIGAFLGIVNCLYVLFVSSLLGVAIGLSLILISRLRQARKAHSGSDQTPAIDAETLTARTMACLYPDEDPQDRTAHASERNVVLNVLSQPPPRRAFRHHLPFGPYLAAGAYLVMLYHPWITEFVKSYINFFGGV